MMYTDKAQAFLEPQEDGKFPDKVYGVKFHGTREVFTPDQWVAITTKAPVEGMVRTVTTYSNIA